MSKQLRLRGAAWGLCVALILAGHAMAQDELDQAPPPHYTQDPIGDAFVGIFDSFEAETSNYQVPLLLVAPIDLNLDGRLDLMVSANFYRNGRQGQMWDIFIREDDGYRYQGPMIGPGASRSIVDISFEAARIRPNPETQSVSFFDLSTGGGGFHVLIETRISGTDIRQRKIALLHDDDEEDLAGIKSLGNLFQPMEPHVRFMSFGPLQERYRTRLHRLPDKRKAEEVSDGPNPREGFFENPEEAYAVMDGTATDVVSSDMEHAPHFESVEAALEYCMKRNAKKWEPVPLEVLAQQFGENALIATLESWVAHSDRDERFFVLNSLTEVVRRSTDTKVRQRFVEQLLTGGLEWNYFDSEGDWLDPFSGPDFNAASRAFLLGELNRMKDDKSLYGLNRIARWAGLVGVEEAIPVLREVNVRQRELKNETDYPLFMRGALIALGRMGDPEAAREMIACIEAVKDPLDRALSLQRLATAPSLATVDYLKRYLFSDIVHAEPYSDWLPVSEAQCAADTLSVLLKGFPIGPLEEQRKWMEKQTEFSFKPTTTVSLLPGLSS